MAYEALHGFRYQYVHFQRPDLEWFAPHPPLRLLTPDRLFFPSRNGWGGEQSTYARAGAGLTWGGARRAAGGLCGVSARSLLRLCRVPYGMPWRILLLSLSRLNSAQMLHNGTLAHAMITNRQLCTQPCIGASPRVLCAFV